MQPGGLRFDLARPFQLTLLDPYSSVTANSDAQQTVVALAAMGVNGFARAVPQWNEHWYLRAPEWLGTYLAITELRIYGHEMGHARVAALYGADPSIALHLHWGVTTWSENLSARQSVEATAAGMNQGERDATRQWSHLWEQRSWTYQEQLSYFLHHFNQSFYVLGSALSDAAGMRQSGDDVADYADTQLSGHRMSRWSIGGPALLAAALSPDMWQAAYGQLRFLGWGERDQRPWRLSAGPVSFGMPHFEVLLGPRDRLVGGYAQATIADRVSVQTQTHVGLDSGLFRQGVRVDVRALPWLTVAPFGAVTRVGSTPIGGLASDDARVGGLAGVELRAMPFATTGWSRPLAGTTVGASFSYGQNDPIAQGIEQQSNGPHFSLSLGLTLP
jgi:hypothetical protein